MSGEKHLGATIDFGHTGRRIEQVFFNETQSRIVISVAATNASAVLMLLELRGLPARRLGTVGGADLKITADGETVIWPVEKLHEAWYGAIARAMKD
jgi:phosphoribosylformylglycinamidine synthase